MKGLVFYCNLSINAKNDFEKSSVCLKTAVFDIKNVRQVVSLSCWMDLLPVLMRSSGCIMNSSFRDVFIIFLVYSFVFVRCGLMHVLLVMFSCERLLVI